MEKPQPDQAEPTFDNSINFTLDKEESLRADIEHEKTEKDHPLRIAIDGPAGTGKSTVAKMVAERLGIPSLNSGQLYRSVAYLMQSQGENLDDPDRAAEVAASMEPVIEAGTVAKLGDVDVSGLLDSDVISAATPRVAKHPGVRQIVSDLQKQYAAHHGAVMEGRAIGTAVMPDADIKVYLTCDPQERVRRREQDGNNETIEELLERDRLDSERENAPLRKPDDAIEIDTTNLTSDEVVNIIVGMAEKINSPSDEAENL